VLDRNDLPIGWTEEDDVDVQYAYKEKRKICPVCCHPFYNECMMKRHCHNRHPEHVLVLDKPEGTRNRIPNAWIGILTSRSNEFCLTVSSYNNGCCVNVSDFTSITLQRCEILNSQYGFVCGQLLDAYVNEFSFDRIRENPLPKQKYICALLEECHFHDILVCKNRNERFYKSEDPPNDPGAAITVNAGTIQINQCSIKKNGGNGIHVGGLCTKAILTNVVVQQNKSAGLNVYNGGIAEIYGSRTDISGNLIGVYASFDYSKGTSRNKFLPPSLRFMEEGKSFERPKYPSTVLMFLPPSLNVIHDNRLRHQFLIERPGPFSRSVTKGNYVYTNVGNHKNGKKCFPSRQCNILMLEKKLQMNISPFTRKFKQEKIS
jgi:hypothetical protein